MTRRQKLHKAGGLEGRYAARQKALPQLALPRAGQTPAEPTVRSCTYDCAPTSTDRAGRPYAPHRSRAGDGASIYN
jgi:hypothetical protein